MDLAKVSRDHLGKDVHIVVIGCAPARFITPFKKETSFPYELYSDPDRQVYKTLGLKYGNATGGRSLHVKSSIAAGLLKSTWRGLKSMRLQGDVRQQGAAFVIDHSKAVFSHIDRSPADHCPIDTLLLAAGREPFFDPNHRAPAAPDSNTNNNDGDNDDDDEGNVVSQASSHQQH